MPESVVYIGADRLSLDQQTAFLDEMRRLSPHLLDSDFDEEGDELRPRFPKSAADAATVRTAQVLKGACDRTEIDWQQIVTTEEAWG